MATVDSNGHEWARLSQLKVRDRLVCDGSFSCLEDQEHCFVEQDEHGKYILCSQGRHYLDGQLEIGGDSLIGLYKS